MAKKKGKQKNAIPFATVLGKYETGNYQNAYDLLKKAKITSNESGVAKQAKVEIANQIALQKISEHDYANAIVFAASNNNVQEKPDFPINFAKGEMLTGISNLYVNKFEEASKFLSKANETEETKHLYFYYILAELFKGEFVSLKTIREFNDKFKNYFGTISLAKVTYLQAIFYLMRDDFPAFSRTLKKVEPENSFQKDNLEALINFIGRKKAAKEYPDAKPLYKLLSNSQLTPNERNYLTNFKTTSSYFDKKYEAKKDSFSTDELKYLCESGKPLNDDAFLHLMSDENLTKYRKYFVFNQASALTKIEDSQKVGTLINKFKQYFFQVPESIFIYLTYTQETTNQRREVFFKNINEYFTHNRLVISPHYIETIGLEILVAITNNDNFDYYDLTLNDFKKLERYQSDILGVLLYEFDFFVSIKSSKLGRTFEKIVSHPFLSYFQHQALEDFKRTLIILKGGSDFSLDDLMEGGFGKYNINDPVYINVVRCMTAVLSKDLKLSKKSVATLEFYEEIHKHISNFKDDFERYFKKHELDEFANAYHSKLKFFHILKKDSRYYKDYLKLIGLIKRNEYANLIESKDVDEIKKSYLNHLDNKNEDVFRGIFYSVIGNLNEWEKIITDAIIVPTYEYYNNDAEKIKEITQELVSNFGVSDLVVLSEYLFMSSDDGFDKNIIQIYVVNILKKLKIYNDEQFIVEGITEIIEYAIKWKNDKDFNLTKEILSDCLEMIEFNAFEGKSPFVVNIYKAGVKAFFAKNPPGFYNEIIKFKPLFEKQNFRKIENEFVKYIKNKKSDIIAKFLNGSFLSVTTTTMSAIFLYAKSLIDTLKHDEYEPILNDFVNEFFKIYGNNSELFLNMITLFIEKWGKKTKYFSFIYSLGKKIIEDIVTTDEENQFDVEVVDFLNYIIANKATYNKQFRDDKFISECVDYIEYFMDCNPKLVRKIITSFKDIIN